MTIKEASAKTGVSADNLRYYERIGLIPPIKRNKSGIRDYDEHDIRWIEFILKFKSAGASLDSIMEYIKLAHSENDTKEARRDILIKIEKELQDKIAKLNSCLDLAQYKIENYYNLCNPVTEEMITEWKNNKL